MIVLTALVVLVVIPGLAYVAFRFAKARGGTARDPILSRTKPDKRRDRLDERRLGYRYADDTLFIQGGGVFTGVVMGTSTDEYATGDETADIALRPVGLAQDLLKIFDGKNVQCQEQVRYRTITSEGWLRQLLGNAWNPTEMYKTLSAMVAEHIKGATPQRMWVLLVRLGDLPRTDAHDPMAPVLAEVLGVAEERLTRKDLAPWRTRATQVHQIAARHGAEPMSRRDLLWLIRKPAHGHLPIPDEPVTRRRPWRGGFFELAAVLRGDNLGGGVIALRQRNPETGAEGISYTATLVVQDQPPRQIFNPRNAWARKLSKLSIPAEIVWRYTLVPGPTWRKLTDKVAANVEDERQDRLNAGAGEDLAFEARVEQADTLRADNAEDPPPGMIGRLRLSVSAPSRKALAQAIQDVKAAMGDIEVEVSEHAALLLLEEQFPGETVPVHMGSLSAGTAGGLQLWARHTDTYQPAIGMLGSHSQVGDRIQVERGRLLGWIGMVIGYVKANGTVAHFDPFAMMNRLNGAGVAVLGASGGGKSSFVLLMFFWLSESGVRCRALDPKIEFRNFALYIAFGPQVLHPDFMAEADAGTLGAPDSQFQPVLPQFWADTEIFDLARGARGSRDPWLITKTFSEGYHLAVDLTDVLFHDPEHRRIMKKGLRALFKARQVAQAQSQPFPVGLGDVIAYLRQDRDELAADLAGARKNNADTSRIRESLDVVDEVCTRLENGEDMPFLRLLLGKGDDPAVAAARGEAKRRTIYTMSGYKSPENAIRPETWTDSDRNAAAAMTAVLYDLHGGLDGRLVPNPVTGDPGIPPSATLVDEANMVTAQSAGRGFLRKATRQGRSLYHALFFVDQRSLGLSQIEEESRAEDPAEVNQFGAVLMFPQKSKSEARMGLELLRANGDDISKAEIDVIAKNLLREDLGGRLRPGDCGFRDPDSRVAGVTIDLIFHVLQRAAQTNAQLKAFDWAHEVPPDPADWTINTEALLRVRTSVAADESDQDVELYEDEQEELLDSDDLGDQLTAEVDVADPHDDDDPDVGDVDPDGRGQQGRNHLARLTR